MRTCHVSIGVVLASLWGASPAAAAAPPDGGTISVEARATTEDYDPSAQAFVRAAGQAFAARGFTVLEDMGHAAYVAELRLTRKEVGTGTARLPAGRAGVAPGGALGSAGAGVSIPLSTGQSKLVALQRITLELRIRKRGEDGVVWDGTAVTVRAADTRRGADDVVATDLSAALLRNYPLAPEGEVGVP